jgi:hypothetical protein
MKITLMFLLSILLGKSCETEQEIESAIIEYTANTRGFYERITITNRQAKVSADRNAQDAPKVVKISEADWNSLVAAFKKVNLDEVSTLEAPSNARFHDGAAIAMLQIKINDKTYTTPEFDHGNPPAAIKGLMSEISKYATRK